MENGQTEGIILKSLDYREQSRIITLFSPEGLISLIIRGVSRKIPFTIPLNRIECHYRRGRSDLLSFLDGTLLDDHQSLRTSLASLQAAGTLSSHILQTQLPGKPSPALYALYRAYLKQVPHFPDPAPLIASFQLKLLCHEGLLHEDYHPLAAVQSFTALRTHACPPDLSRTISALFLSRLTHP
ncbi:MAG: DNA repair protein RecO [Verrucomicrobia bacterium]|nr:DNA repair protein RecO [Verrucomicrobiota bacterium]